MHICAHLSLSLSLSLYIYIYIYIAQLSYCIAQYHWLLNNYMSMIYTHCFVGLSLLYNTLAMHAVNVIKLLFALLDVCVSSLCRGHANMICIVPMLTDDPRGKSLSKYVLCLAMCCAVYLSTHLCAHTFDLIDCLCICNLHWTLGFFRTKVDARSHHAEAG